MKKPILLVLPFLLLVFSSKLSAQINEAQVSSDLQDQVIQYEALEDLLSQLPDHLSGSMNELASKGDELNELYREIQASTKEAGEKAEGLRTTYDTFESALSEYVEEKCPTMAKKIYSAVADLEDLVELGDGITMQLEEETEEYNEKNLLKTFKEVQNKCQQVREGLSELEEELVELFSNCG